MWHNKMDDRATTFFRLDRAMIDRHWIQIFPSSVVNHLPINGSDHASIILDTRSKNFQKINRLRFEAKWLLKDNFINIVKSVWSMVIKVSSAFQSVRKTNLFKKKL